MQPKNYEHNRPPRFVQKKKSCIAVQIEFKGRNYRLLFIVRRKKLSSFFKRGHCTISELVIAPLKKFIGELSSNL